MAQEKSRGWRDAIKVVGWGPVNLSPKTTFAGFTTWSIGVVLAGSIGALLIIFALTWQWEIDIPVLLALGALGGAVLGALIYHFGFALPFLWLRTMLAPTPFVSATIMSSDVENKNEEEPYDPRRNPLAPDKFQPKPEVLAVAGALSLPLTLRPHISPLYWVKLEVFMTALMFLLFLPLSICQDGPQALSIPRLAWLALIAAGGCFIFVISVALSLRNIGDEITATDEGLMVRHSSSRIEFAPWSAMRAWLIEAPRDDYSFASWTQDFTIWGWDDEQQREDDLLSWDEPERAMLGGLSGWLRGRKAYRERADLLHAVIAVKTGLAVREAPYD